ncbi:hypothetical protein E2C01_101195 [Portunus trituberculatus]|uniref:Uncharacterized protein n=1 Tax=Portunus trituberculatus TaxID=210409 RepID=A0A5B7KE48_PORTR|nr:hypothetical protein [Portunus trituberculatus]
MERSLCLTQWPGTRGCLVTCAAASPDATKDINICLCNHHHHHHCQEACQLMTKTFLPSTLLAVLVLQAPSSFPAPDHHPQTPRPPASTGTPSIAFTITLCQPTYLAGAAGMVVVVVVPPPPPHCVMLTFTHVALKISAGRG